MDQYKDALQAKSQGHLQRFLDRALSNPEGCRAEALMHWFLSDSKVKVVINEDPKEGGPDFSCESADQEFYFEVTILSRTAVAKECGVPDMLPERAFTFSAITKKLFEKAVNKVDQLAGLGKPAVLAITTEHSFGSALMDEETAQCLLIGKTYYSIIIGEPKRPASKKTDLEDSVFYSLKYDQPPDHCRRDISAILIVHITGSGLRAIGVMNPEPTIQFSAKALPNVLFFAASQQFDAGSPAIRVERLNRKIAEYLRFPTHE